MTIKSPLEWYTEKYCSHCKNKKCEKKGTGIYVTSVEYNGKVFCALAALMLLELDRASLKEFAK